MVILVIQLMLRCTFLVPLLDTQFCTIAAQCINSLEAPEEPVKIVENGLEHRHLVLVSYIYVAGNLTVLRGNALAIQGRAGQEPYRNFACLLHRDSRFLGLGHKILSTLIKYSLLLGNSLCSD